MVWVNENTEPFGNSIPDSNPSGLGAFTYNLRFPGQYADSETNTSYNMMRDYDAATGRYRQSDPIGLDGGINTYSYVEQMPLSSFDPDGLSPFKILRVVISVGVPAYQACKKIPACNKALEEAIKACKNVKCVLKREKADHKFSNGKFCEHYRLVCFLDGAKKSKPIFDHQWPLPGRCFKERQDEMSP